MIQKWFKLSLGDLYTVFSMAAVPLHLWAFFLIFNDFNWVAERSTSWDAVGLAGYSLALILAESLAVFVVLLLVSLALPKSWSTDKRLTALFVIALALVGWAIGEQVFFANGWVFPVSSLAGIGALFVASIVLPLLAVFRSDKAMAGFAAAAQRITVLTTLYLLLDGMGIVVVILRNL